MSDWTIEEASELVLEHTLDLLDGCDDDDVVRPGLVLEAIHQALAPAVPFTWPQGMSAGQLRSAIADARRRLAEGMRVP